MTSSIARNLVNLKYIRGNPIDIPSLQGKRGLVVEFWATWCPPCRATIGHLTELAHKYADHIDFIGVTSETDVAAVTDFVNRMGSKMDYTVAMDLDGSVTNDYMGQYNISGIPHAFLVDKSGKIVFHSHPTNSEFSSMLDKISIE